MDDSGGTSCLGVTSTNFSLFTAPYMGTEIGVFIFLSRRKFPRNRRFLDYSAKTGSDRTERFRGKRFVPGPKCNGIWMTAVRLPVWAGHRQVCHFFFLFVCLSALFLRAPTDHSF